MKITRTFQPPPMTVTFDIPDPPKRPYTCVSLAELERRAIRDTIIAVNGLRREAADALGIGERTLYRKMSEWGESLYHADKQEPAP